MQTQKSYERFLERYIISDREKVEFIKNFATLLGGGIAVNDALHVLAEGAESKTFSTVILRMSKSLEEGAQLASAFAKEEHIFGAVSVSLLRVGEMSGSLDESLLYLSLYLEHSYDLNQEVSSAMIYPKFIFTVTISVATFLVGYILPKLVPVFKQLHVTLPLTTRILLALALFIKTYWLVIVLCVAVTTLVYYAVRNIPKVRFVLDRMWLSAPLFGKLIREYQLALFCQLFLTLFKAGSPVDEALLVTGNAAINVHYRFALARIRTRVEEGATLSASMKQEAWLFPKNMLIMIAASEQSGSLERAFTSLSEYYGKEVRLKTKKLPSLIEPALLILIAFVVGFVALSIIMPIYEITRGVSR